MENIKHTLKNYAHVCVYVWLWVCLCVNIEHFNLCVLGVYRDVVTLTYFLICHKSAPTRLCYWWSCPCFVACFVVIVVAAIRRKFQVCFFIIWDLPLFCKGNQKVETISIIINIITFEKKKNNKKIIYILKTNVLECCLACIGWYMGVFLFQIHLC